MSTKGPCSSFESYPVIFCSIWDFTLKLLIWYRDMCRVRPYMGIYLFRIIRELNIISMLQKLVHRLPILTRYLVIWKYDEIPSKYSCVSFTSSGDKIHAISYTIAQRNRCHMSWKPLWQFPYMHVDLCYLSHKTPRWRQWVEYEILNM